MGTEELTPREFDVLEQIVHGKSNKDIATELVISEATVKTHVNSLLGKLGVTDRTQAATAAIQRGIVPLESSERRSHETRSEQETGFYRTHPVVIVPLAQAQRTAWRRPLTRNLRRCCRRGRRW